MGVSFPVLRGELAVAASQRGRVGCVRCGSLQVFIWSGGYMLIGVIELTECAALRGKQTALCSDGIGR